jgi:hypothetical protein
MIPLLSTLATGASNGFLHKEGGIPTSYKYTVMSVSAGMLIVKAFGTQPTPIARVTSLLLGLFVGIPIMTGGVFCTGTFLGKTLRHVKDTPLTTPHNQV